MVAWSCADLRLVLLFLARVTYSKPLQHAGLSSDKWWFLIDNVAFNSDVITFLEWQVQDIHHVYLWWTDQKLYICFYKGSVFSAWGCVTSSKSTESFFKCLIQTGVFFIQIIE